MDRFGVGVDAWPLILEEYPYDLRHRNGDKLQQKWQSLKIVVTRGPGVLGWKGGLTDDLAVRVRHLMLREEALAGLLALAPTGG
jgi:hypothetical protein